MINRRGIPPINLPEVGKEAALRGRGFPAGDSAPGEFRHEPSPVNRVEWGSMVGLWGGAPDESVRVAGFASGVLPGWGHERDPQKHRNEAEHALLQS